MRPFTPPPPPTFLFHLSEARGFRHGWGRWMMDVLCTTGSLIPGSAEERARPNSRQGTLELAFLFRDGATRIITHLLRGA